MKYLPAACLLTAMVTVPSVSFSAASFGGNPHLAYAFETMHYEVMKSQVLFDTLKSRDKLTTVCQKLMKSFAEAIAGGEGLITSIQNQEKMGAYADMASRNRSRAILEEAETILSDFRRDMERCR